MAAKTEEITEQAEQKRCGKNLIINSNKEIVAGDSAREDMKSAKKLITGLQVGATNIKGAE